MNEGAVRSRLTAAEIQRLNEDGYFLCGKVLTDDELAEARQNVERALAEYTRDGTRPEKINFVHTYDPYFLNLASHPRLLDLVESVLGPDLALFSSHLLCKPAVDGQSVAWHQDASYWPLEPMEVLTLWLALDDCDVENGCMRVIPRTHKQGEVTHRQVNCESNSVVKKEIATELFDVTKAVPVQLKAGQCSLHFPWLIHGSEPNRSGRRRAGLPIRYIPTTTRVLPVDERSFNTNYPDIDYRKIVYLIRGRDRAGNTYGNREMVFRDSG